MINIRNNKINALGLGYGELALKGKNRGQFEENIKNKIYNRLREFDTCTMHNDLSKIYIYFKDDNIEDIKVSMKKVFGINNMVPAVRTSADIDSIKDKILELANELYEDGARNFKVEVNRADKKFPINSMDFARELGAHILINSEFTKVKMKEPDVLIQVDIRREAYIFTEKIRTYGGLPLGSAGKGLSLLSGGIDSPVASFMMSKRGMKLDFVTFHSFPFTSMQAINKIKDLVKILSMYNGKARFYSLNILPIQEAINKYTDKNLATILTRRAMMRLAQMVANRYELKALITGESLGQVASQTLSGLTCTNASVSIPVFRPLIGMDKLEIIEIAEEIGTYEKSIEPHEDTCALFAPKHPNTNPRIDNVEYEESKIEDYDKILEEIFNSKESIIIKE